MKKLELASWVSFVIIYTILAGKAFALFAIPELVVTLLVVWLWLGLVFGGISIAVAIIMLFTANKHLNLLTSADIVREGFEDPYFKKILESIVKLAGKPWEPVLCVFLNTLQVVILLKLGMVAFLVCFFIFLIAAYSSRYAANNMVKTYDIREILLVIRDQEDKQEV